MWCELNFLFVNLFSVGWPIKVLLILLLSNNQIMFRMQIIACETMKRIKRDSGVRYKWVMTSSSQIACYWTCSGLTSIHSCCSDCVKVDDFRRIPSKQCKFMSETQRWKTIRVLQCRPTHWAIDLGLVLKFNQF